MVPPEYSKVLDQIIFLFRELRTIPAASLKTRVTSGLTPTFFRDLIFLMSAATEWASVSQWIDEHVYTHGADVTTTVRFSDTGVHVDHVKITSLQNVSLHVEPDHHAIVHLRRCIPLCEPLPVAVMPTAVSIRKYKLFVYKCWHIKCVQIWTGSTREAAETLQHDNAPVFEICIDYVPGSQEASDTYLATSLLLKLNSTLSADLRPMTLL